MMPALEAALPFASRRAEPSLPPRLSCLPPAPPPQMAQPGSVVKLQYNRLGGPLASFDVPQDQNLTLKIGGWGAGRRGGAPLGGRAVLCGAVGKRRLRPAAAVPASACHRCAPRTTAPACGSPPRPPAGHNNWKAPQDVKMVRSAAPGPAATAATSLAATITGVDLAEGEAPAQRGAAEDQATGPARPPASAAPGCMAGAAAGAA